MSKPIGKPAFLAKEAAAYLEALPYRPKADDYAEAADYAQAQWTARGTTRRGQRAEFYARLLDGSLSLEEFNEIKATWSVALQRNAADMKAIWRLVERVRSKAHDDAIDQLVNSEVALGD